MQKKLTTVIIMIILSSIVFCHAKESTNQHNINTNFNQIFSYSTTTTSDKEFFCFDGQDNDGDGLIDCQDNDCHHQGICSPIENICNDGRDNDMDGNIDCEDPDCKSHKSCDTLLKHSAAPQNKEVCNDGYDNNNNGFVDCNDSACTDRPGCTTQTKNESTCDDQRDNDGDGKIDCADPDCYNNSSITYCQSGIELSCNDNRDNDGDGKIDCADPNCIGLQGCSADTTERSCHDGRDNDGDGKIDCADPDCTLQCTIEICHDNIDNDRDGKIDCLDIDCHKKNGEKGMCEFKIETSCSDGVDNNQDGRVDCEDPNCASTKICNTQCGNSILEYGEQCDDGNKKNNDGCSSTCQKEKPSCELDIYIQGQSLVVHNRHDRFETKNLSINQSKKIDLFNKISFPIQKTGIANINRTAHNTPQNQSCNKKITIKKIPGCTNSAAINYNKYATRDDGSCTYSQQQTDCNLLLLDRQSTDTVTKRSRNKQLKKFPNIKKISLLINQFAVDVTQLDRFEINQKITTSHLQTILKNGDTLLCKFR